MRVIEAKQRDVGKKRARITHEVMNSLGIAPGDIVELIGKNRTAATVWPVDEDDIEGKEEIEENIKETINKTAELAKSKRGLPFLALLMRVCKNKPENLKILLETDTDLIKKVLEHEISQIYLNYIYDIYNALFIGHIYT